MIETQEEIMTTDQGHKGEQTSVDLPNYLLHVSCDRISVLLDCPDPHSDTENLIQQILADFKLLEIPEYPDQEILANILASACKPGESLRDHTIMMGQKARQPTHGRLEWARDFFAEGWQIDEKSGAIDFWAKLESRAVHGDELLVSLHPPVEGTPGLNVFGNEIPVTKPNPVKLRAGKNVQTEEKDGITLFKSTCAGRVHYSDGTVSVNDVYVIKGNVNLETGNIVHTGAVMIQGDVGAGATIETEGDILVKGMLEPCNIKCGGSLTVAGGIVGEDGYSIELGGDLLARYISEATIEAKGNILVGNEIAHSQIRCLGRVDVPKGRIAGGFTLAQKGIKISEAGASGASDTTLVSGVDFTLRVKIHQHEEKIKHLDNSKERIQAAVNRAQQKRNLSGQELKTLNGLKENVKKITQALSDEQASIQKLKSEAAREKVEEIIVLQELWSGTTIQLGTIKTIVRSSILKPRIALKRKHKVKILPLGDGNMPEE
jgi:uncharacterized protein